MPSSCSDSMADPPDLANPSTIRAVARRFGVQFQRRWGQNFLADRGQLEQPDPPRQIDLLVQKEVAQRIASPGGDWSLATLSVRAFGSAELILAIPKEAFFPVPKVASALLRIVPEPMPVIPRDELPEFFKFVRPFFQARRKQLPYVLTRTLGLSNAQARAHLSQLGIDPARRPETLSLEEWRRLFAPRIVP